MKELIPDLVNVKNVISLNNNIKLILSNHYYYFITLIFFVYIYFH